MAFSGASAYPSSVPKATPRKAQPLIALLCPNLEDPYQQEVCAGAIEAARASDCRLVVFTELRLARGPMVNSGLDELFSPVRESQPDGLIVVMNALGTLDKGDRLGIFLDSWGTVPLLSVGRELAGRPCVRLAKDSGMGALALHLREAHGYRRFLFLAGSASHPESLLRERDFRQALGDGGGTDSNVIIRHCDFRLENARLAVLQALAEHLEFDAIVAANDRMAMGAIAALEESGIAVPTQMAVTGYDDLEITRSMEPPLTTIRLAVRELGRQAVEKMIVMRGAAPIHRESGEMPQPEFIIRHSCGCPHPDSRALQSLEKRLSSQAAQQRAAERRNRGYREILAALASSFELPELLGNMARGLDFLNVKAADLVLYRPGSTGDDPRLHLRTRVLAAPIIVPEGQSFSAGDLVPGRLPGDVDGHICLPLRFAGENLGYLMFAAGAFDFPNLLKLVDHGASALKGAQLLKAERQRSATLERQMLDIAQHIMNSIGRDIHDELCQDIASISLQAALLEGNLKNEDSPRSQAGAQAAALIAETASQTAARAKGMARGLYPAVLAAEGLVEAVSDLVRTARSRTKAEISLEIPVHFRIGDSEKALQLYRIVQEALGNALTHSRATAILVALRTSDSEVEVRVEDNGIGLPNSSAGIPGQGMGLQIMRYRSSLIDASFHLERLEPGTRVRCTVRE